MRKNEANIVAKPKMKKYCSCGPVLLSCARFMPKKEAEKLKGINTEAITVSLMDG